MGSDFQLLFQFDFPLHLLHKKFCIFFVKIVVTTGITSGKHSL